MADEKSIVLKIETITDQSVMEAYGKTLNDVLGTYEENIALITDYNKQIKANEERIKAINKEGERWGKLSAKQTATIQALTAENGKLKQAKSELIQVTKNQEKIESSMSGTMQNQSQILGKLRMAWRMMTDEQKKANPEMLQTIQQLDQHLKDSDASIGNFQRNVGNYKSAIDGLTERFPMLGGAISKVAGKAGVMGLAVGVVNSFWNELKTTQMVGDTLAIQQEAWTGVWQKFVRMIATADFSNFIQQLTESYDASKKLAEVRDQMFEKENSIRLLKAKQSVEEQQLLMTMRDQTKTDKERIAAGQRYAELVKKNVELQKQAYTELAEAELDRLAAVTGADKEALRSYIENYADPKSAAQREELKKYEELLRKEKSLQQSIEGTRNPDYIAQYGKELAKVRAGINATSQTTKDFYELTKDYDKSADNIVSSFVSAMERAYSAEANALQTAQRAMTTVNSLRNKDSKEQIRVTVDLEKQITAGLKAEWKEVEVAHKKHIANMRTEVKVSSKEIIAEFNDIIAETDTFLQNEGKTKKVAESPFARALGVTDEEFEQIKSSALNGAQQIFNSISQLSQQATQRRLDEQLEAVDREAESEKAILEGKLEKGLISQKEYEKRLAALDEETAARKEEANKEAFEKQKKWNIANALMNMALAITNIWATNKGGTIARAIETAVAVTSGLAQVAIISSQKYARGGELRGPSHAQGGIKGFVGNQHIEAEGGEVIINKRSSAKHRNLLSLINSDNGWGDDFAKARGGNGRFFARGGVIGGYDFSTRPLPDSGGGLAKVVQQQTANLNSAIDAINKRIDNLRVFVTVNDIEAKYNEKRVHLSRATL